MKSLKVNDKVLVISGSHKGSEAKIVSIDKKTGRACLEGIREVERHMRKSQFNPAGGQITVHLGIDLSNLKLVEAGASVKSSVKKVDKSKKDKADKKAEKKAKKGAK